jgi:hypothetical protein
MEKGRHGNFRFLGDSSKYYAVRADLSRLAPAQLQSAVTEDVSAGNSGQFSASRAMHPMT